MGRQQVAEELQYSDDQPRLPCSDPVPKPVNDGPTQHRIFLEKGPPSVSVENPCSFGHRFDVESWLLIGD